MRRSAWFALIALATLVIATIVWWPRVERGLLALHGIEVAPASAKTAKSSSGKEEWPSTHAGLVARHWVAAYDSGDVAMRRFYESRMSPESLKKKSPATRLESYRTLRDRIGKLMLASVVESEDTELTVSLLAEDGVPRDFIFTLDEKAPHWLVSVTLRDRMHGGHGGGHGGGHP